MVFSVMLGIVSLGMLFNALKEKEVPAERFVGFGVLFILWGVTVLFPSFGEAPVELVRSMFR
jgi:hypothetical protein